MPRRYRPSLHTKLLLLFTAPLYTLTAWHHTLNKPNLVFIYFFKNIFFVFYNVTAFTMATTSALDTSTNTNTNTTTPPTNLYEYIASYDFSSDLEFRKGLGTILGHPETPASDSELVKEDDKVVLQAKCFYISRFGFLTLPCLFP